MVLTSENRVPVTLIILRSASDRTRRVFRYVREWDADQGE